MKINFKAIEKKWQDRWAKVKVFEVKEKKAKKKKYYLLEQFAYPSGSGLHMGHAFVYTIGDIYARFKRMVGFNVLHPVGYDSLGLPAENAAIKAGIHPKNYTDKSIKYFSKQLKALGFSYDWSRVFWTHDPKYYKWDQWIFLKMFEKGLVYQKKSPVNFCGKCNTVLANEQVHNGRCWIHHDMQVKIKHLNQWYFKITNYAEELNDFSKLSEWPDIIKRLQKNWIGESYGIEINFEIKNPDRKLNCVIVHGCPSDREKAMNQKTRTYDKHWIPWIKSELDRKGIKVEVPLMPKPWKANYSNWKREFEKNDINKNTILVGHSCGSAFLVRWLGETKKKIKKLILVAPWKIAKSGNAPKEFYDYEIDSSIKERVGEIIIFTSNNEATDGKKSVEVFHKFLDGELIELKDKGHYTLGDMGTEEFPELLDKIVSNEKWPIFTTRPDTICGVTFMVISAQHPRLMELVTKKQKKEIEGFLKRVRSVSEKEMEDLEKQGAFTGSYAVNPLTNRKVPVYVGNFVLADYGCGMVMAVPAHDQRDFEFAKKYKLPVKEVIKGGNIKQRAYIDEGVLVNSGEFNGLNSKKAIEEISKYIEKKKLGKRKIQYKLRDWLVSRQRYWGTPIPIIYCDKCGVVPVSEKDLPILLPEKVKFGKGNPLETAKNWIKVKCPKCGQIGKRETDTMDTFVNSSWYYLRYCDPKNDKKIFNSKKADYWVPIDVYVGGKEHACMHDIYIRFYTKFLRDLGLLKIDEPAVKLFVQGMIHGEDGNKMSKSLGNVIDPLDTIKKYSADSLRLFLVSVASPDSDFNWSERGVQGSFRFINKVFSFFGKIKLGKSSLRVESKVNKAILEITKDIEHFKYNLAVIKLRGLFDSFEKEKEIGKKELESFLKMFSVFCPYICEELWASIGGKGFISLAKWPVANEKKINKKFEEQDKAIEKLKIDINNIKKITGKKNPKTYIYVLPKEIELYKGLDGVKVFSVADKKKYDPEEKSKKAKPGKPAIYLE